MQKAVFGKIVETARLFGIENVLMVLTMMIWMIIVQV